MIGVFNKVFRKGRVRRGEILFQIANLMSAVLSVAVVTSGGFLLYTFDRFSPIFKTFVFRNVGELITLLGCFGIAFAFVGCVFYHYKKKGLVGLYVISVVIIYCGEVGAGLVLVEKKAELRNTTKEVLEYIIGHYYGKKNYEIETASIDFIQMKMKCCGVESWKDWLSSSLMHKAKFELLYNTSLPSSSPEKKHESESSLLRLLLASIKPLLFFNPTNKHHVKHVLSQNFSNTQVKQAVPTSCCIDPAACTWRGPWNIYTKGCLPLLTKEFSHLSQLNGIFVSSVGFVQVLGTMIGACIVKWLRRADSRRSLPI